MTDYPTANGVNATIPNFTCCISTTLGGGGAGTTTATPSGDRLVIWCQGVSGDEVFNQNWKDLVGGSGVFIPDGKKTTNIIISGIKLLKIAATNTENASTILDYIRKSGRSGAAKRYLFVYSNVDAKYLYLSYSSAGASQNYSMGILQANSWDFNNVSEIKQLKWRGQ